MINGNQTLFPNVKCQQSFIIKLLAYYEKQKKNKQYKKHDNFPFLPKQYKYLNLVVGYAKKRDIAVVEVIGYRFIHFMIRANLFVFGKSLIA